MNIIPPSHFSSFRFSFAHCLRNEWLKVGWVALGLIALPCCKQESNSKPQEAHSQSQDQRLMTPEEVIPLLAHSIEMNSSAELENYKILCEAGESAFPAMAKILLDGKEPDVTRSIIPFFVDTKGDKTIPLQAMSKYVEMHARNPSVNQEICSLFIAFGDIGGANEVTFLKQYLDVKDPIIRASIEGNIERIEKRLNPEKPRIPHP